MTETSREVLNQITDLIGTDPKAALDLLANGELQFAKDLNFRAHKGGLLIDIGSALGDGVLIKQGISAIREIMPEIDEEHRPTFLYNLGSGYSALHYLARQRPGFVLDPDNTPLLKANESYREALENSGRLNAQERAQLHVNYGNSLSNLGRTVEAIGQYEAALRQAPEHPMAWGNLGVELQYFASISGEAALLNEANAALDNALASDRLEKLGEHGAREQFVKAQERVQSQLSEIKVQPKREEKSMSTEVSPYADFCLKNQLFLNFSLKWRSDSQSTQDDVTFFP